MSVFFNNLSKQKFKQILKTPTNIMILRKLRYSKDTTIERKRAEMMSRGLPKQKPIDGVKNIILISSGKGGVGKSTTAVNLACALKLLQPNHNTGLLDADIFGPSIPLMMNLHDTPLLNEKNLMEPLINYGVKCMSMGFLIEEGSPVIWRGLMVMQALEKLIRQVAWGTIDYLIIDTPPGTGDTHLSLIQNLPINGVILVTTPQSAALQVVKRGAVMYKKLSIPIIGLVENMASVKCANCLNDLKIFGSGTLDLANEIQAKILQSFPLEQTVSCNSDLGVPIVIAEPNSLQSKLYRNLAENTLEFLKK